MIRTVLIDDETDSILVLRKLLETYCPQVDVVGTAEGVETALAVIQATRPDLLFLDIEMMQGNAFDLLNQLRPVTFQVVFVTAFDNYAIRAFKYSAVDYLLKPVDIDELVSAVQRVSERSQQRNIIDQMQVFLDNMGTFGLAQQKMAVPTVDGLIFINLKEVVRLEAKSSYTQILMDNGEVITATRTIKDYEDILPEALFCRIHNSHIINLFKIEKYNKGRGGYVTLEDGSTIEVASRRRQEFLRRLLK
ncbi:MAG TPA: LytTR family DNA-binding domain-containing protein [Puia sp.]|jgi:two-component system LytT family response regulator|nr:LytTR family DNA-binding domain-containing protein [Puia sp.]